jgi:hypothetical protein
VQGQTDSERVFALITAAVRVRDGDIGAGIVDAVGWLADAVPIFALNVLLGTAGDIWAPRYPETHDLFLLARRPEDDPRWAPLAPGEVVHVDADLNITRRLAFPRPPRHQLRHADLTAAAASQHPSVV